MANTGFPLLDWPQWRVWPDGTVQCVEDGPPHSHMSDDFMLVRAEDESTALWISNGRWPQRQEDDGHPD
jgi:hypothetical protein